MSLTFVLNSRGPSRITGQVSALVRCLESIQLRARDKWSHTSAHERVLRALRTGASRGTKCPFAILQLGRHALEARVRDHQLFFE
jgi:hypothetical protein